MHANRKECDQTSSLFKTRYESECRRVTRFMIWLMAAQWVAGFAFATFYSPLTWIGQNYEFHVHVWAALYLGGLISGFAILWARTYPNAAHTRHVIAICQMLWSALLIHLTGGRIETHFHVFASLAILSIYRDWKILITATVIVAVDHFIRGVFYPLSAFGIVTESPYRWIEHAAWVLFEVAFLVPGCMRLRNEIRELCHRQSQLEAAKRDVDRKVDQRTEELVAANALLEEKTVEAEKLALVARYTDNAVVITDGFSRIEWVNEGFTRLTGYTSEEVIGKKHSAIQHQAQKESDTIDALKAAIENKTGFDAEVLTTRKNGEQYWLSTEIRPIHGADGTVCRFIAIESDISERKSMEMSLAAAEQRLRSLVDNVPGALYRCRSDHNWSMVFVSKSIKDITGYDRADFVVSQSVSHADFVHPDDSQLVQDAMSRAVAEREPFEIEYRLVCRDGSVKWVWERGLCLESDDGTPVLDGMIFDVNERKLAEAEIASKGTMIEESLNEIFIFDAETLNFRYVNRGGRENIGYSLEELIQMTPMDIKPGLDQTKFKKLVEPLRSGVQKQLVFHTVHQRKNGTHYDAEIRLQLSRYQDQEVFLAMILDVTDRLQAEAKNHELQKELVDASRKAGMAEVATGVLHNVGNILNSVNVSAAMIRRRFEKSALANLERVAGLITEHEESFAEFVRDDSRGKKIPLYIQKVTDALSDERVEIGDEFGDLLKNVEHIKEIVTVQQTMAKTTGLNQELNPREIISDVLTATKSSMANHKIEIIQEIQAEMPPFISDKHKILQILINLVGNAKDALIEHEIKNASIKIDVSTNSEEVVFRVTDNGIGIPKDKISKIFQLGFTTKKTGHGFGLHSSANAATELGGLLSVNSEGYMHGATFSLRLPITPNANCRSNSSELTIR